LVNGETISSFILGNDWEKWLLSMAKDGVWGDHLSLLAIASINNINIIILTDDSDGIMNVSPIEGAPIDTIILCLWQEYHYGAIQRI